MPYGAKVNTPDFGSGNPRSNRGGATKMPLWRNLVNAMDSKSIPIFGLPVRFRPKAQTDRADSRELKTKCYGKVESNSGQ